MVSDDRSHVPPCPENTTSSRQRTLLFNKMKRLILVKSKFVLLIPTCFCSRRRLHLKFAGALAEKDELSTNISITMAPSGKKTVSMQPEGAISMCFIKVALPARDGCRRYGRLGRNK